MHELAIVEDVFRILEDLAKEHQLKQVDQVNVEIGAYMQIVPELFESAFEAVKVNTVAGTAKLNMHFYSAVLRCHECGHEFEPPKDLPVCPQCNSTDNQILRGKDIYIKSIEGE